MKKKKREIASLEEIASLFQNFLDSALSMAEFARQQNIHYSTFCNYKRRLVLANLLAPQTLTLFSPQNQDLSPPQNFYQLLPQPHISSSITKSSLPLEYGPFKLSLSSDTDLQFLNHLLEVLRAHV